MPMTEVGAVEWGGTNPRHLTGLIATTETV